MVSYDYGQLSGDFLRNAASKARDVACDLYSRFPKWAVGNVAIDSPAWQFAQGAADSICAGSPTYVPPALPAPQFNGGQCECVSYRVNVRRDFDDGTFTTSFVNLTGKIRGADTSDRDSLGRRLYAIRHQTCVNGVPSDATSYFGTVPVNGTGWSITSIVRNDSLPDDCGNPPPDYPPSLSGSPTEAERTPDIVVPDSGGNSFNIPVFLPPDELIGLDFNVKVDVGGITFNFDAGGVTFEPGNKNSGDGSPGSFDRLPEGIDIPGLDDIKNNTDRIPEIEDKLDEQAERERERERKPPDDPDYEEDEKEPGENSEDGVEGMKWLIVELTKLPPKGYTITKSNGQIVAYAGWVEFRVKGKGLPRQQLNYPINIFPAPESADGYSVTFTKGSEGKVTVIKERANA